MISQHNDGGTFIGAGVPSENAYPVNHPSLEPAVGTSVFLDSVSLFIRAACRQWMSSHFSRCSLVVNGRACPAGIWLHLQDFWREVQQHLRHFETLASPISLQLSDGNFKGKRKIWGFILQKRTTIVLELPSGLLMSLNKAPVEKVHFISFQL